MSRIWGRVAALAAAGGLIAASGAIPAEATTASYSITIAAKVKKAPVTKDKFVLYKGINGFGTATIHGQVSGAITGDVVTLLAKPFGAKRFASVGTADLTVTNGSAPYSFTVRPTRATAYRAQVKTGTQVDATSTTQTVYVLLSAAKYKFLPNKCSRTSCTSTLKAWLNVPAAAYKSETTKHTYLYAAVGHPRIPSVYTLSRGTVSKPRKISATRFELTLRWHIKVSTTRRTSWRVNFCEKDTESRDGMNLPGHHGCGNRTVSVKRADKYIG